MNLRRLTGAHVIGTTTTKILADTIFGGEAEIGEKDT